MSRRPCAGMAARSDVGKPAALLRFDARLLDDLSPFIHLGAEKSGKFIRRGADHLDTARFELAPDRRLREGCNRIGVNFSDDVPRRLGGHKKCRPGRDLHPATPASVMVGRSGATESRLALATARPRSWPWRTNGRLDAVKLIMASMRPGMTSLKAGPAPR